MGGINLREFWMVAAHTFALLDVLGSPVDRELLTMMEVDMLLVAIRRQVISSCPDTERDATAKTMQLVSSVVGFLQGHQCMGSCRNEWGSLQPVPSCHACACA